MDFLYLFLSVFTVFLPTAVVSSIFIFSALWVYQDAKKNKFASHGLTPEAWSILTLLLWIPTFPAYFIVKMARKSKKA